MLIWLAALAMVASAALRIANVCGKGADARTMWLLVVLPVAGCLFYVLNILCDGKERLYRSSIPVMLLTLYYGIKISMSGMPIWLIFVCWVAYVAVAAFYTVTVSGQIKSTVPLLLLLLAFSMIGYCALREEAGGADRLEKQASAVLSRMEGAGRVEVTIMTRKAQTGGTGLMKGETGGEVPCGAMAVAQGADDPLVRMQLEQALCALLGLPNSAVSVVTGGK